MPVFTSESNQQFYRSNLISEKGQCFQLAYADTAAYLSPYLLQIKADDEKWYLFQKESSDSLKNICEKVSENQSCKILKDVSLDFLFDERLGLLVSFFGHWYSRYSDYRIIKNLIDGCETSKEVPFLMRKILLSQQSNPVYTWENMDPQKVSTILGIHTLPTRPQVVKGHTLTVIGRDTGPDFDKKMKVPKSIQKVVESIRNR